MTSPLKKLFNTGNYPNSVSSALLILRLAVGTLMLTHGYGKLVMLFGDAPIQFADPIGLGVNVSLGLAVFAEFFCSIFLIFGLATRFATIPLIITMLVAAFIVHLSDPFMRKELPLLYTSIYIVLSIAGAGKYSIDHWIHKNLK